MSGTRMAQEMAEQPARLSALAARADELGELVREVRPSPFHGTTIVARGSSDHAATYGRYLIELASGLPVSLAAPSLHTLYEAEVDYSGQLVLAVSQSGHTPEIVTALSRLRASGGSGLAITNDPASELARAAGQTIELEVGDELAVPATKTVTAQLMVFATIARALGAVPFADADLRGLADSVSSVLADPDRAARAAQALEGCTRLIVVARGLMYGAALEIALKLEETCSLLADGYSAADLRHGPIAAVTEGLPVVALSAPGPAHHDMVELVKQVRARGARVLEISPDPGAELPIPATVPESLAAIPAVVRGQQLARSLALHLGLDPDSPAGLSKVTAT